MSKVIFITGGATGIGRATVKRFVKEGWNVSFMDFNIDRAEELQRELDFDEKLLFVAGDTRSRSDLAAAVKMTVERYGGIDSLFANAGIHQSNTMLDISEEDLHRIIDINIYGTVYTLKETVPAIIARGGGTVVINCSDQWFIGKPHSFAYGLTKGALGQITRSLSIDLAKYSVRVNAICPGTIDTPLFEGALRRSAKVNNVSYDKLLEEENSVYARGKIGSPDEVANLVFFLAGDQSSFCTGGHYIIDGGLVAG